MRKFVFLVCMTSTVACAGSRDGRQDSLHRDSTPIPGPPAVPATPTAAPESIAARPRAGGESRTVRPRMSSGVAKATSDLPKPEPATSSGTASSSAPIMPGDTVRGIVSVVGTDRDRHVMVAPPGGVRRVEITGHLAAIIGHTAGADVWVTGPRTGTSLEAQRFVVRMVDGMPALDGTLKTEGAMLYIVTVNGGRTRIVAPPPPLLGRDGARVWITGDPSRAVSSFGFIDPPR